ncbi:MAG: helix-turn-helix domain-containing protein [Acetobacter sp.]|nr:helix-turn-helix domain-containing protein [Bacteroides sp.]MCM1342066.1 helix-turn-helix domain-containing protein [Acetobacter sp.]MCM1432734.1 helix-turn-helix domain-containing protein [Clostridiales bacterium]
MFGEKLKKLRIDNNLTQDELAEKIFVTRTAVSKWENNKGYPSIDSLKELSNFFGISIDELISDDDVQNKRLYDKEKSRKYYFCAIGCLCAAVIFTMTAYFTKTSYFNFIGIIFSAGYIIFGFLSKPADKKVSAKKLLVPYFISRMIVFAVVVIAMISTIIQM